MDKRGRGRRDARHVGLRSPQPLQVLVDGEVKAGDAELSSFRPSATLPENPGVPNDGFSTAKTTRVWTVGAEFHPSR